MNLLPVITRELRAESRRPFTYWMRTLSAMAVVMVCAYFYLRVFQFMPESRVGGVLFGLLHVTLFFTIWILVPLMTADCISCERREGTLGLLFLTPLRPRDIVLAKGFAHGVRALMVCAAVLPMICVPVLMGGVTWQSLFLSFSINFSSLLLALAAGLLASAGNKIWTRAVTSAAIWSAFFLMLLSTVAGLFLHLAINASSRFTWNEASWLYGIGFNWLLNQNGAGPVTRLAGRLPSRDILITGGCFVLLAVVTLTISILIAARSVRRNWQELPPSRFHIWWQRTCCTPVLMVSLLERWMQRKLDRNPVGWLELRSWTGRTVIWGWFAIVISLYSMAFTSEQIFARSVGDIQSAMAWLLAGSMAVTAAGSFRRERETGVLELLLVSPLGAREIISGRLRGIWSQFFPAMAMLLGVWLYWLSLFPGSSSPGTILFFAATFVVTPMVGLYFSLAKKTFLGALLCTVSLTLLLPSLGYPIALAIFLLAPGFSWSALHERLENRRFNLERV